MSGVPAAGWAEMVTVFGRIGLVSFGGPAGQIALMHRELVGERGWLSEAEFLRALNFCMLLPGPEAMQLATYAGWRLAGIRGGLAAGLLFVLPGAVVILAIAAAYAAWGRLPLLEAVFFGIKAAVLAIVLEALLRVARRALRRPLDWAVAGLAFAGLFAFAVPFPLVVAAAALAGFLAPAAAAPAAAVAAPAVDIRSTLATVAVWTALWAAPVILVAVAAGPGHVLVGIGVFFGKLAIVTFGGAYAALAYITQQAVETHGWLTAAEMIDGLGLAETTPGPLILVTEFVGYLAGLRGLGSVWGGIAGAAMTLWVTFVPSFLWIFAGAPYVERLAAMPRLSGALAAVTAAVVGVIASLAAWFALHVLFAAVGRLEAGPLALAWPVWSSLDGTTLALAVLAGLLLAGTRAGVPLTLAVCAGLGVALRLTPG